MGNRYLKSHYATLSSFAVFAAFVGGRIALAGVTYDTVGGTYSQNFDNIAVKANVTNNGAIQANTNGVYTHGWQDDVDPAVSTEDDISVPGWHLFHPLNPGAPENGFNNFQRLRIGTGSNTGAFYLFSEAVGNGERALGSQGSTTVAANGTEMYFALQLVNNTGQTLHSFTLTFDGEQWRDGYQLTAPEKLRFAYSTVATDALWTLPGSAIFTPVPALDFTAPVNGNQTTDNGIAVNGNVAGKVAGITATVSGFTWEPGRDLWLRWGDVQATTADDQNLGIDNLTFTASTVGGGNSEVTSVAVGPNPASAAASWSDNAAPSAGKKYRVLSGHTITVDQLTFAGDYLRAATGGTVNFNDNGNGANMRVMVVDQGAFITETATGDFRLGDANAELNLGILALNASQTFTLDPNSDFELGMAVHGDADLTFNSNGVGSDVRVYDVANLNGTIKFNGSGDMFELLRSPTHDRLEMNSTGQNILRYSTVGQTGGGSVIFNSAGTFDHASTVTSPNSRLIQKSALEANAPVSVDLKKTYGTGERRLSITDALRGSANVTVEGTVVTSFIDRPGNGSPATTLNEFELGSTGDSAGAVPSSTYSGILTANNFVNVELRRSLPSARIVVNNNAVLEMGRQVVGTTKTTSFGEIEVTAGGTLEVGFEQYDTEPTSGHHVGHLRLVASGGRAGTLNLASTATTVMQINGKTDGTFDTIKAEGNITLGGTLRILVNPGSSLRDANPIVASRDFNSVYTPAAGDEIVLIEAIGSSPTADFIDNDIVDDTDFAAWKAAFGTNASADANGDGDSDGGDFLAWQSQYGRTFVPSSRINQFSSVVFVDVDNSDGDALTTTDNPDTATPILVNSSGLMTSLGLRFDVVYTPTQVKLVVSNAAISAVPEPAAAVLVASGLIIFSARRRRQPSSC